MSNRARIAFLVSYWKPLLNRCFRTCRPQHSSLLLLTYRLELLLLLNEPIVICFHRHRHIFSVRGYYIKRLLLRLRQIRMHEVLYAKFSPVDSIHEVNVSLMLRPVISFNNLFTLLISLDSIFMHFKLLEYLSFGLIAHSMQVDL